MADSIPQGLEPLSKPHFSLPPAAECCVCALVAEELVTCLGWQLYALLRSDTSSLCAHCAQPTSMSHWHFSCHSPVWMESPRGAGRLGQNHQNKQIEADVHRALPTGISVALCWADLPGKAQGAQVRSEFQINNKQVLPVGRTFTKSHLTDLCFCLFKIQM